MKARRIILTGVLAGIGTGGIVAAGLMHIIAKVMMEDDRVYKENMESVMDNMQSSLNKAQQVITQQAESIDELNNTIDMLRAEVLIDLPNDYIPGEDTEEE